MIYARISEDREGSGLGVERQLEDQCVLFDQLDLRLAGVYADNDLSAFRQAPAGLSGDARRFGHRPAPGGHGVAYRPAASQHHRARDLH